MNLFAVSPREAVTITPRGVLSEAVMRVLQGEPSQESLHGIARDAIQTSSGILHDDDLQLALFALYLSMYGSFEPFDPELEWNTELLAVRDQIERAFEAELRRVVHVPQQPVANAETVAAALFELTDEDGGPSVAKYLAKQATLTEAKEFLKLRSIYTLREADPHSWAIPRLRGRPKAALIEIQSDEYGGGRVDRVHAEIFAATMRAADLDDTYGAYVDDVPAIILASVNMMSMFGLNRRLLGAIVGHLAAFEMTSSIPNRLYGNGFRRLGYGTELTDYFDEHVEADAVHEQIAGRDLAGTLAEDKPEMLADIMFGAAACLAVDGWAAEHMLQSWSNGKSALRSGVTR